MGWSRRVTTLLIRGCTRAANKKPGAFRLRARFGTIYFGNTLRFSPCQALSAPVASGSHHAVLSKGMLVWLQATYVRAWMHCARRRGHRDAAGRYADIGITSGGSIASAVVQQLIRRVQKMRTVSLQCTRSPRRHDLLRLLPHPARKPHNAQDRAIMLTLAQAADMTAPWPPISWRSPRNASPSLKDASKRCARSATAHAQAKMHRKLSAKR